MRSYTVGKKGTPQNSIGKKQGPYRKVEVPAAPENLFFPRFRV